MANRLRFDLELLDHPYSNETDAHLEAWGWLSIWVLLQGQLAGARQLRTPVPLFSVEWDLSELAEWFALHRATLHVTDLPSSEGYRALLPGESIAQALR